MKEFMIFDAYPNTELIAVAEDRPAANRILFRYLSSWCYTIGVLKHQVQNKGRRFDIMDDHYIVIGNRETFSAWLEAAFKQARHPPVVHYVDSLEDEAVSAWVEDIMPKELWTYSITREYNRDYPTRRVYSIGLRHFAPVSRGEENDPALRELKDAAYISAKMKKEEFEGEMIF